MAEESEREPAEKAGRRWPGSPWSQNVGGSVEEMRPGYSRLSLVVEPRHTNSRGSVHGGVITSLMDAAMGIALRASHEPGDPDLMGQTTIEMNVSFLKPAPLGERVVAEARLLNKGRNIAVGDVEVRQQSGDLVAKGRLTYFILRRAR